MKKIISILLTAALTLSMCPTLSWAENDANNGAGIKLGGTINGDNTIITLTADVYGMDTLSGYMICFNVPDEVTNSLISVEEYQTNKYGGDFVINVTDGICYIGWFDVTNRQFTDNRLATVRILLPETLTKPYTITLTDDSELSDLVNDISVSQGTMEASSTTIKPNGITSSGTCGDSLKWVFYDNGELSVTGDGDMYNYVQNVTPAPWSEYRDQIKTIEIGKGVTGIGNWAFAYCTAAESVNMPSTIERIGQDAFVRCSSLTSLTIPDGVGEIGIGMFYDCASLASIGISADVTSIDDGAFYNCSALSDVYYSGIKEQWDAVTIGADNECLKNANIHYNPSVSGLCGDNVTWSLDDGTLSIYGSGMMTDWSKASEVPWYQYREYITTVYVSSNSYEDKLISIGEWAFADCINLKKAIIEERVGGIGRRAFHGCENLEYILLSRDVTSIGASAFVSCTSLENIYYTGTSYDREDISVGTNNENFTSAGLNYVKEFGVYNSHNYDIVYILGNDASLLFLGSGDMDNMNAEHGIWGEDNVKSVIISDGITSIEDGAFMYCDALVAVKIPDSVTKIGNNAFDKCESLKSITIPSAVTSIGDDAFNECSSIKNIVIPDGVTSIGEYTFADCSSLESITIPDSVASICKGAFYNDSSLKDITIPARVTDIGEGVFAGCAALREIEIPDSVTSIGAAALANCSKLTNVKLPFVGANATPDSLEWYSGGAWGLDESTTRSDNFGYIFGTGNQSIPASLTKVEITNADKLSYIPSEAFKNCGNIYDIIINGGVLIGDNAFENCRNLRNLYIPESVSSIGTSILSGCTRLETLTVPFIGTTRTDNNSETSVLGGFFGYDDTYIIGTMQYYDGNNYHYYKLPSTLKNVSVLNDANIPTGAFSECSTIENISIVTGADMGKEAFYHCENLRTISLPRDLQTIGQQAFAECESLEAICIPANVKAISSNAFYNCRALNNIVIPDSVTTIANDVFNGTSLFGAEISLFANKGTITCSSGSAAETYAIEKGIKTNIVPSSELDIKKLAVNVAQLSTGEYLLDITDTNNLSGTLYVEIYNSSANLIASKNSAASNDVEYRVVFTSEEMKGAAFARIYMVGADGARATTEDTYLSINGGTITEIVDKSGKCGDNLTWTLDDDGTLTISGTGNMYDWRSFVLVPWTEYMSDITNIVLDERLTSIGSYAFYGCGISNIKIPDSVSSVGEGAFRQCRNLQTITVPDAVTSIGAMVFSYCSSLTSITIPAGVTSIGDNAFDRCNVLDDVYYDGTESDWNSITIGFNNDQLKNATIHYTGSEMKFDFGNSGDVTADDEYTDEKGYGFTDSSAIATENGDVKGSEDYAFKIKVPNGNYIVSVETSAESITSEVIETVTATTGIIKTGSQFDVAVCDGVLDLTFPSGSTLSSINVTPIDTKTARAKPAIYAIGDSTTNNTGNGARSWGNCVSSGDVPLPVAFSAFENRGRMGRDSIKYYNEGSVEKILLELCPGDYVTVNLGINSLGDEAAAYETLMSEYYVQAILDRGGIPVIVTATPDGPVGNYLDNNYNSETGKFTNSRKDTCRNDALRRIAKDKKLNIIELGYHFEDYFNSLTMNDVTEYNADNSTAFTSVIELVQSWYIDHNHYCQPLGEKIGAYILESLSAIAKGSTDFNYANDPYITETPSATTTPTPTVTPAASQSPSPSPSPTPTATPTSTPTATPTISPSPSPSPTPSPTPTATPTQEPEKTSDTDGSVTWVYSDGTLTLTGTGNIGGENGYEAGKAPWYHLADRITSISIGEGITAIGDNAFYNLTKATEVSFPSTITAIGNGAFENCTALKELILPAGMSGGIGNNAFKGCESLNTVTVPDRVKSIGSGAFENCKLKEITIPFVGLNKGNTKETFSYIFGDNVPITLRKVTITDETIIPANAFKDLSNIETITLNSGVTAIGSCAFEGCASLKAFEIPQSVTAINDNTFKGCENAVTITVHDSVTDIGISAFDGCKKLQAVNIPNGIMSISDHTFRNCASLTKIEIPTSVEIIGEGVLAGCDGLVNIKVPFVGANSNQSANNTASTGIFGYLFGVSDNREVPPRVTRVEITSTDRTSYIPKEAFKDCGNIVDIIIDGGRLIDDNAFENCKNLKNVYIPKSISNMGDEILLGCTRLETLTIPFIGIGTGDNNTETSVLGSLFGYDDSNKNGTLQYYNENISNDFHYYMVPTSLKNVSVLRQTTIPTGVFSECDFIKNITIVTAANMSNRAFYHCASLERVTLPADLRAIGDKAFAECERLETINIPTKVRTIGKDAFYNARSLRNVTMPDSVTQIAEDVFNGTDLFGNEYVSLFASKGTITCSENSEAYKYAVANGIETKVVPKEQLDVRKTATTVTLLSDHSYLFDIIDAYNMSGTLHVELYNEVGNKVIEKTLPANKEIEYRVEFTEEEMSKTASAKIYIVDEDSARVTTEDEVLLMSAGEIPELPEGDITMQYDNGKISFSGDKQIKSGTVLLQAIYNDDNSLNKVIEYNISSVADIIDVNTDFAPGKTKFMIWDSLEKMKPLSEALEK